MTLTSFKGLDISYGQIITKFDDHFNFSHNQNIIFSGKYGIGKTTFLKTYFEQRPDIIPVRISPVNYVISSNENIFELIKTDIIKQLYFEGFINFNENFEFDKVLAIAKYAKKHPLRLGQFISKALSKLHPIAEVAAASFEGIHELIEDFSKFESKLNKDLEVDESKLLDFLEEKTLETGSYIEYNIISRLISDAIAKIKQNDKEVVLYIDDMDRLDPEHIFRILNIFSAHHDQEIQENKFGFNKVLIVCDLNNIKSIFHHKYGVNTDFDGYIDKFYSEEIFEFSNEDAIHYYFENVLKTDLPTQEHFLFISILKSFLLNKRLSVRQLMKHTHFRSNASFEINRVDIRVVNPTHHVHIDLNAAKEIWFESDNTPVLKLAKYLITTFGSIEILVQELKVIEKGINTVFTNDEEIESILHSFAIISRLIRNRQSPLQVYFSGIGNKGYSERFRENVRTDDLNWPTDQNLGFEYRISPKWIAGNKYKGDISFYYDYSIDSITEVNNNDISIYNISRAMLQIVNYIDQNNFKYNLGISS